MYTGAVFEAKKEIPDQTRSMILTSQVPVTQWHEQIGDPTLADGILGRLVHNAHRVELRGESMQAAFELQRRTIAKRRMQLLLVVDFLHLLQLGRLRHGLLQRRAIRIVIPILSLLVIFLSTFGAVASENASAKHVSPQKRLYAPYLFMGAPDNDMVKISKESGIKWFTLAFLVSSGSDCQAAWFAKLPLPLVQENAIAGQISQLRKSGGDVIISFGGEGGLELAQVCKDVPSLQAQYQAAIDKYKVRMLDFDIESSAITDPASIDRRNQVLAHLQAASPDLLISYTLAVLPTGLVPNGIDLLKNSLSHGVKVGNVNIMTMDYSPSSDPNAMGQHAIDAGNAALKQLQSLGIDAPLGLTPMIGMNDVSPQVFTLEDANKMLRYAKSNGRIRRIAIWSVARDRPCTGTQGVSPDCSGVAQKPFAFSQVFKRF
jgi:hypothetical protein